MAHGQPEGRDVQLGKRKGEPGQQREHPGKDPQRKAHQAQPCHRQNDRHIVDGGGVAIEPNQQEKARQQCFPEQGRGDGAFQFRPEGPEKPAQQRRVLLPDAPDGAVVEGGGGGPQGHDGQGADQPQAA